MANSSKMKLVIGILMVMALISAVAAHKGGLHISRFLAENGNEGDGNKDQGNEGQGNQSDGNQLRDTKAMTCNKNPEVCYAYKNSGSGGPNCCNNKCVTLLTDGNNCGKCNNKCQFTYGCCNGKCANVAYDTQNCGKCGNKCKKGRRCVYGMCSYA